MAVHTSITQEYLKDCLDYSPDTGDFIWKFRPREHFKTGQIWKMWNTRWAGKPAGYINHRTDSTREDFRYHVITINNVHYKAHRLAYLYVHGYMPEVIDHINCDPADNRISNLRPSDILRNGHNRYNRSDSESCIRCRPLKTGYPRYRVSIEYSGKMYESPYYRSKEEAKWIYNIIAEHLHGSHAVLYETSFIPPKDYYLDGKVFDEYLPDLKKKIEWKYGWENNY